MSTTECSLCEKTPEASSLVFWEYGTFKATLARPKTLLGHTILFPHRHGMINFNELSTPEKMDYIHMWGLVEIALLEILNKERIVFNKTGGIIPDHFHMHIFPVMIKEPWVDVSELLDKRYVGTSSPQEHQQLLLQLRQRFEYDHRPNFTTG